MRRYLTACEAPVNVWCVFTVKASSVTGLAFTVCRRAINFKIFCNLMQPRPLLLVFSVNLDERNEEESKNVNDSTAKH